MTELMIQGDDNVAVGRSRLRQVFDYLRALDQLRNPARRAIEEQPWHYWLRDLPDHPAIRRAPVPQSEGPDGTGEDYVLRVRRPPITLGPPLPPEIEDWVVLLDRGDPDSPIEIYQTINVPGPGDEALVVAFQDDPLRVAALAAWEQAWETWAAAERPTRKALEVFEHLYALYGRLDREGERLELVLGDGILTWRRTEVRIHHPLLLQRLELEFSPEIPEFIVRETDHPVELYSPLFRGLNDIDGRALAQSQEELESATFHPLGGAETSGFLRALVARLSARGQYLEDTAHSHGGVDPQIYRSPVLFLRSRTLGFASAIDAVQEDLRQREDVPTSLLSIMGIEANPVEDRLDDDVPQFLVANEVDDVLLSKPANPEQVQIARRLKRYGAVLVQGPPGTGKTHTIGNLIGHLLAHGKSVLVTSHTSKALRVLHGHIVPELQPLCVPVLGSDSDNREALERAVSGIAERLTTDADALLAQARRLEAERSQLLDRLSLTRQELLDRISEEYRDIALNGEAFPPSTAARLVALGKGAEGWIPGSIEPGAPLPLSVAEIQELYRTNTSVTERDEQELDADLPSPSVLSSPVEFAELVKNERRLNASDRSTGSRYWGRALPEPGSSTLNSLLEAAEEVLSTLDPSERWKLAIIQDGLHAGSDRKVWTDLLGALEQWAAEGAECERLIAEWGPTLPDGRNDSADEGILSEIRTHLAGGGRLDRFGLLLHPSWKKLIADATVSGASPSRAEHFEALTALVRVQRIRRELLGRWDRLMERIGGPESKELGERPERVAMREHEILLKCLEWQERVWKPFESRLLEAGFDWKGLLGQVPPDLGPFGELARLHRGIATDLVPALRARANAVDLGGAEGQVQALSNQLSGRESELVQILRGSVARRDSGTYEDAYGALVDLCGRSAIVATRRTLLGALEPVASVWADQIRSRTGAHGLPDPPGAPDLAWRWKQLVQELDRRGSRSPMELQRNIEDLRNRLEHLTAELIDRRAWAAQVQRVGVRERQALIGWLQTMKKIGKGTGKRAPQLMAEARRQMSQCRNAVPVWIMPLARVVENFDPRATRFDVVVIDEASQSDIMAMIALYFGKQVLVVGDEEQVSPDAVGQNLTAIGQLIAQYLRDVPNGHLYDGQTSIYDLAKASFGGTILLREHFRCVPEIIQFSNALSYDWRLKPLRDASHVVVKPPLVAHRVAGHDDGRNVNLEEALTTATLIAAASEQPEYESTTFGVISLVGEQQAIEIDRLLRTYLSPVEYERRRILCGNPAHFQGDERDVMFLSVVDGPRSTSLPLRDQPLFKKRFNVAASRARDQMWLIYSLNPSTDLKPGDLRRRLIQHALDPTDLMTQLERVESAAESEFERQVAQRLVTAGYSVTPQWPVGYYRIDLVVGNGGSRLAIECDGDRFHPLEKLPEDMERQAILERLGWTFVRLRGSEYFRSPDAAMGSVFQRLADMGITPQDRDVPAIPPEEDDVRARVIRRAAEIRRDWEENPSGARGGNDSGHGWVDPTAGRSEVLDSESAADYGQGAQGPRAGPTGMRDAVPSQISGPPVLDSSAIQDRGFDGITALYKTIAEKYGCAEASVRFQLGRDGKPPGPRWAPLWEWRPSLRDRDGDAAQVLWLAVLKLLADGWYARVMEAPTVSAGQTVTRELVEQLERVDASKAEPTPGSQPLALDAAFEGGTAHELFNRAPEPASAAFQEQPAQSSDLAPFLRARGIPFVDQRHKGGRFWLVGGSELNDLITEMRGKGLIFQAAPRPKATGRKPGWWLESGDTYTVDEAADENDSKST